MAWPTLADLARLPLPGTDGPIEVRFAPDGSALTYLAGDPGSQVRSLWRHDPVTGERTLLAGPAPESERDETLSLEERLQRERRRTGSLGITEYAWIPRAARPTLVVPHAGGALVGIGEETVRGPLRPLEGVSGAAGVAGSPDGRWLAFVREGDVWLARLDDSQPPERVTHDAGDGVANGLADYVAAEELARFEGMWWSWDGALVAFARVDERDVPLTHIAHLGEAEATHESHRYPYAGGPNARVSLRIVAAGGSAPLEVSLPDAADGGYLARVVALPAGGWLVATLPRHQRELRWSRLTPDGTLQPLWTEAADPWINLDNDTRPLSDGRVLRSTERTGYRHLELRDPHGGEPQQLTAGEWVVTRVVQVDERRGLVHVMGTCDGATQRHLYRVPLDAPRPVAEPERLTEAPGWHEVVMSEDGDRWADTWSDLATAPGLTIHASHDDAAPLNVVEPSCDAARLGVPPPELLTLVAADGQTPLHAAIYRPTRSEAAGGGPPPCVVWVYGGPHAQYVKNAWEATVHPLRQYLAAAGVAVLAVDNRGSAFRGLEFEALLRGRLGSAEVTDQAAAVRQLAARGEIDLARVGITGGSYGGYMTLRAMALEPEIFRVGVAVAPVTEWRGYDTAYTERYLGMPDEAPAAYEAASALEVLDRIRGSLLLIHGAIDENVHLRHSVRALAVLQAAGRDVELVLLPADRHRTRSASGPATRDRRTVRYLLDGLGVPLPEELSRG